MKRVHRKEASENHWASAGMPEPDTGRKGRGRRKGKGKGVLDAAVGEGQVGK